MTEALHKTPKSPMPSRSRYLRLSEHENALDYVERVARFVREAEKDVRAWKWVTVALHGALYGFAVCACEGTDSDNVLDKEGRLIGFHSALKRCQDSKWMRLHSYCDPLILLEEQRRSIRVLLDLLRNEFVHFAPKGWMIEIHGLPGITIDVLAVIRFLALQTAAVHFLKPAQRKRLAAIIDSTVQRVRRSGLYREAVAP